MNDDLRHLRRALRLAARGRFGTSPNPMVGAVVVRGGEVVGEGWHHRAGEPHAEREALAAAGERARGATLYVSLEPCCHHGRTPPCTDAVLEAGVRRVVACHRDPNPRVGGQGFARLRQAGLTVASGLLVEEAVRLNLRFLAALVFGRPAVTLKWAMSLDGKIATAGGDSRWISSPRSRRWSLDLREEHDAILVGSGTVLDDDPQLTRRPPRRSGRSPAPNLRVILDRRLRTPATARIFAEEGPVVIYTRVGAPARARRELEARGADVVELGGELDGTEGGADRDAGGETGPGAWLEAVLADLRRRGVQSLLVEGGGEIHAAFVAAGLYDRALVACAPLLVGGRQAPTPLGGGGVERLAEAPRLEGLTARRRGDDLLLTGYRSGCLQALYTSVGG
jgi:diaminohydroxyphosphoribosylaminopyrimidine deaminase/5-amino-6-(5-phosphoribosylamino)uracil reductase